MTARGAELEKLVTLTIEPGVFMRFTQGCALKVQHFTNLKPSTAALKALGTAAKRLASMKLCEQIPVSRLDRVQEHGRELVPLHQELTHAR